MKVPVSLKAVVDEIDGLSEDHFAYLNLQTGELVTLSAEEISAVEEDIAITDFPEWQQALIAKARDVLASDNYLQLPMRHDIHEYAIMEHFCNSIVDKHLRNILLDQIQGAGAFRRFKQTINHYDIAEDWYQYRANSLEALLRLGVVAHRLGQEAQAQERGRGAYLFVSGQPDSEAFLIAPLRLRAGAQAPGYIAEKLETPHDPWQVADGPVFHQSLAQMPARLLVEAESDARDPQTLEREASASP
jgi:hypothetical protein